MSISLPPHSPEAERAILGSMLMNPKSAIPLCVETLNGRALSFYDLRHRMIYESVVGLADNLKPVDTVTIHEALRAAGNLESCGGDVYIAEICDSVPSTANLPSWIEEVNGKKMLRDIIQVARQAAACAYDVSGDVISILEQFERKVAAIRPRTLVEARTPKQIIAAALAEIDELARHGATVEGLETGLPDLDKMTGGLKPGEMTVIAGYPGGGKTSLALNLAEHALLSLGKSVAIFSLEMSAVALVKRFLASHARVNLRHLCSGYLVECDFPKIISSASRLSKSLIWFEEQAYLSTYELRSRARRLHQEHSIDLVVIDYIQLLSAGGGPRKLENRQQEVSDISREIKAVAVELNIPVVALSQLNDDGKLRESRAIGQDADNVWVLQPTGEAGSVNLVISKARNGPRGKVPLVFFPEYTRFEGAAVIHERDIPEPKYKKPYAD